MSELSPEGGSEGYGAGSDEAAARLWSSWKARSFPAWPVCWTSKNVPAGQRPMGDPAKSKILWGEEEQRNERAFPFAGK